MSREITIMRFANTRSTLFLAVLIVLRGINASAWECPFKVTDSGSLTAYLDQATSKPTDRSCIALAIRTVGAQHYAPAVPVLVNLLDFRRPLNSDEKIGVVSLEPLYPAVSALVEIGDLSLPFILAAIKSESASPKARENAIAAWMQIFKYKPAKGIRYLKEQAETTNDTRTKGRLLDAVSKAMYWCAPSDKRNCTKAAENIP